MCVKFFSDGVSFCNLCIFLFDPHYDVLSIECIFELYCYLYYVSLVLVTN